MRPWLVAVVTLVLGLGCTLHPLPVASVAECRAAGYPLHLWRGQTEYVCLPDPMDPMAGHESDFARRRAVDAGVRR